jgi:hypothetical protein
MSADLDTLRRELAGLRRQVRVLGVLLAGALGLAGTALWQARRAAPAGYLPPPDAEPEVLVGRSVYLRELPGEPYVRLKYLQDGAGLLLADNEGRSQVLLVASPERGRLLLGSVPPRIALESDPERPSLTLRDGHGLSRVELSGGAVPRLALLDDKGQAAVELTVGPRGGALRLLDARGQVAFEAPR